MAVNPSGLELSYLFGSVIAVIIPLVLGLLVNCILGAVAVGMAKKRGLRSVPAFFAAFFGSFIALFFIAMFPVKDSWN